MSRTHHATRTWRLSCGHLRDYPGMPLGKVHHLLCGSCRKSVTTEYPYPEHICGYQTVIEIEDRSLVHVCCTSKEGNKDCSKGVHYDRYVQRKFKSPGRLRSSEQGQVNRP